MATETDQENKSCEGCGATIYPEHIESGRATYWGGHLLCAICLEEKKAETGSGTQAPVAAEESLTLVDEEDVEKAGREISAFGGVGQKIFDEEKLARQVDKTSAGASRVRVFHTRMADGAVAYMAQNINEWLDANPDVEVKFVQSVVGDWEGKRTEPHLILTVWY